MKILKKIKKKWLQHRVYKYTLKYNDSLSKQKSFDELSSNYNQVAKAWGPNTENFIKNCKLCHKYKVKGDHYENLADIYLSKKLDLEKELQY